MMLFENDLNQSLGVFFVNSAARSHIINQFRFSHASPSPLKNYALIRSSQPAK